MKISFIVLLCFVWFTGHSQHCGWDFASIIVLKVNSGDSTSTISDLNISLIDSTENCIDTRYWSDTCRYFKQNTPTDDKNEVRAHTAWYNERPSFWFADDYYVLVFSYTRLRDYTPIRVRIEDKDGEKNQGQFQSTIIDIENAKLIGLCTNSSWDKIKPIQIILGPVAK